MVTCAAVNFVIVHSILYSICYVKSQSPAFLVDPVSVAAVDGTTVEFTCTAENVSEVTYRVNGTAATMQEIIDKGFIQNSPDSLGVSIKRRNLTVNVLSKYNNTEIFCRGIGEDTNADSDVANLTVQGKLGSVGDLNSSFLNFTTVNISWSPPFTLPGTAITGYNISVTKNGKTTNYFTSYTYYMLILSESLCNEINVTVLVAGYNGLAGETSLVQLETSDVQSTYTGSMESCSISTEVVPIMTVTTSSTPDADETTKKLTMTVTTSFTSDDDGTAKPPTITVTASSTPDDDGAAKSLKAMSIAIAVTIGAVISILLAAVLH